MGHDGSSFRPERKAEPAYVTDFGAEHSLTGRVAVTSEVIAFGLVQGAGLAFDELKKNPPLLISEVITSAAVGAGIAWLSRSGGIASLAGRSIAAGMGVNLACDLFSSERWTKFGTAVAECWNIDSHRGLDLVRHNDLSRQKRAIAESIGQPLTHAVIMNTALCGTSTAFHFAGKSKFIRESPYLKQLNKSELVGDLRGAYYRTQWKVHDKQTEIVRNGYGVLNKFELRHPIQRLSKLGRGELVDISRPALTAENNPITAFEKKLPEYLRAMEKHEQLLKDTTDRAEKYRLYDEMKETRQQFANDVVEIWHGKQDKPGIVQFSDKELSGFSSVGRVAEIRRALSLHAGNHDCKTSPFVEALTKLDPHCKVSDLDSLEITKEIHTAKERLFDYDYWELKSRMGMPRDLHYKDHDYDTPADWMPFEPTDKLANLFHGSVSNALPSICQEKALLPSWEMRLKGVPHITGESFDAHFAHKNISITRDFSEAFNYHLHSPDYITGYPIIFGISRDVVPKMYSAGMFEPGEFLINRLNLGSSLLSKLRRKPQEITHIYAPDGQVTSIKRQLASSGIKDVSVVGFNELQAPEWLD